MSIVLPKKPVAAASKSPNNFMLFSKPKIGKTELLAQLPNSLLIDLEDGSDFVEAVKIKASSVDEIIAIGKEIQAEKKATGKDPYQYIILDTITALETMCESYAETLYSRKAQGKNWFKRDANGQLTNDSGKVQYGNILNLPNGAGQN